MTRRSDDSPRMGQQVPRRRVQPELLSFRPQQLPNLIPAAIFEKLAREKPLVKLSDGDIIYSQDDTAEAVFYILKGRIKISVVSALGKEAVVAILEDGHFFGEASLVAGQTIRPSTATSIGDTIIARFTRDDVIHRLHSDDEFTDAFVSYLVGHGSRMENAFVDQLLNSTEKRLARVLLLLANFGKDVGQKGVIVPKISQETLAHMVGASRARVCSFLNKFKKQGYIEYSDGLRVHNSLLKVILED
jgi:CRP-like cAMP-binding protein